MLRLILLFGLAAGLIVIVPMSLNAWEIEPGSPMDSALVGYLTMLVGLSLIFVGVKRYRDKALGGVIKFLPAFLMGLGISAVAGVIYVIGWETTLRLTDFAFVDSYTSAMVENARAQGKTAAEIEKVVADMADFRRNYMNPAFRLPVTFVEMFPVGVLISLVTAALLRNSRFMPARTTP